MSGVYRIQGNRILLDLKASPNASATRIAGISDGRLRLRVAAAPEDGKANAEIKSFLAKRLDCPKSSVELLAGEKSKLKTFALPVDRMVALNVLVESADIRGGDPDGG